MKLYHKDHVLSCMKTAASFVVTEICQKRSLWEMVCLLTCFSDRLWLHCYSPHVEDFTRRWQQTNTYLIVSTSDLVTVCLLFCSSATLWALYSQTKGLSWWYLVIKKISVVVIIQDKLFNIHYSLIFLRVIYNVLYLTTCYIRLPDMYFLRVKS